jgi:predicted enzyme related to lactoylglutathione lyase
MPHVTPQYGSLVEGETMTVKRIQNTYIVVRDMTAQRSFYEQALGLDMKFSDAQRWTQFRVGEANFSLSSQEEARHASQGATLVFEVDDLEAVAERIVSCGGRILHRRDMGTHGCTLAFSDPEGYTGQLFRKAPLTDR